MQVRGMHGSCSGKESRIVFGEVDGHIGNKECEVSQKQRGESEMES
jgi:hypothetical protein